MNGAKRALARPLRRCVVVLVTLGWAINAGAQPIYKWVDRSGVTQYSASPPPVGASSVVVRVAPPPSAEAASQAKASAQQVSDAARRQEVERSLEQAERSLKADTAQRSAIDRLQRCAQAREQLSVLTKPAPVYRYGERGDRVYLEDNARDAEIAQLRLRIDAYCSSAEEMQGVQDAATRQRAASAAQQAKCNEARAALRDLQAEPSRLPAADIEAARQRVRHTCGGEP